MSSDRDTADAADVVDIAIVGAGIAGLTLARELQRSGHQVLVLERARGAGGRCATRRADGGPIDHGLTFLHGRSPQLREALDAVPGVTRLASWPLAVDGEGAPCRPEAFAEHEYRVAFVEGVNRFARYLAIDVPVRLESDVVSIEPIAANGADADRAIAAGASADPADADRVHGDGVTAWRLRLSSGDTVQARVLVLTIPAPSAVVLLEQSATLPEAVRRILPLVSLVRMLPCLTVMARYAADVVPPVWDVSFPRTSPVIHSVTHDSRKRAAGTPLTLVVQARPAWSRAHQDEPPDAWAAAVLAEAGRLYGPSLATPVSFQAHRWRKARVDPGTELAQPVVVRCESGATLAFAGDGFHRAGGIEGAFLSGLALASRLHSEPALQGERRGTERSTD